MNTATQIYEQTIRQLPMTEHLRLAILILADLTQETQSGQISEEVSHKPKLSVQQLLKKRREKTGIFKTPAEADEYLNTERKSWNTNVENQITKRGQKFYDEHLKHILEPEHIGEFVSIEPESSQYFLGKTDVEAIKKGRKAMPDKMKYLVHIGFKATYKFWGCKVSSINDQSANHNN